MSDRLLLLLVEDSEDDAVLVLRELRKGGFDLEYERVDTPEAMQAALERRPWHLVISDHAMPHFDSFGALKLLQARGLDLPFIIVSGTIGEEVAVRAMKAGAHDFVLKGNLGRLAPAVVREIREANIRMMARTAIEGFKQSEQRYREVVDNIGEGLVLTDANLQIQYANAAADGIFGVPLGKLVGRDLWEFLAPAELEKVLTQTELRKTGARGTYELQITRPGGENRNLLLTATPRLDAQAGFQGSFVVLRDITERKQTEEALYRSQTELAATYQNAPIIMCLLDASRKVRRLNRAGQEFAGRSETEMIGQSSGAMLGCLNTQDDPRGCGYSPRCPACRLHQAAGSTLASGQTHQRIECKLEVTRNGSRTEMTLLASTARIDLPGETLLLLCLEDITARVRLEEQFRQAQKMEAVGQLAGGVAHDFNNIITATMMHLGLLQDEPSLSEQMKASLQELEVESRRAANLTRQLLMFSRRQVVQKRHLDLNQVVEQLLKMLRRLLGEQVDLVFQGSSAPVWIEADGGMMEQLIMNLAVNARDAMSKGGKLTFATQRVRLDELTIQGKPEARPGSFVRFSATDAGCGMDEATLKRIFKPFFTTKEVGKGTGLGLATVQGIVKQHAGWIEVESAVGRGTTFHVYLPAAAPPESARTTTQAEAVRGGTETILVVEDESALLDMVTKSLQRHGYHVVAASNGPEALVAWQQQEGRIDLLFTDFVMPGGMNGLELAQCLQLNKPALKFILSSGYTGEMEKVDEIMGTAVTFFPKPYDVTALAAVVRKCLDEDPPRTPQKP